MLIKHGAIALIVALTALACGSGAEGDAPQADRAPGGPAARPAATDVKQPKAVFPPAAAYVMPDHRGEAVDLRDFQGKIVVLNFWATWCGPCRFEIPHLVQLRKDFRPEDVVILGASIDRGTEAQVQPLLARFIAQYGMNYPVLVDNEGELLRQYIQRDLSQVGVPMTFIIDRQGRLFSAHEGLPMDSSGRPNPGRVLATEIQALLDRE
jgi:peroxiredoxin